MKGKHQGATPIFNLALVPLQVTFWENLTHTGRAPVVQKRNTWLSVLWGSVCVSQERCLQKLGQARAASSQGKNRRIGQVGSMGNLRV